MATASVAQELPLHAMGGSTKQMAQEFGIAEKRLRAACKAGELAYSPLSRRQYFIFRADVVAWLRAKSVAPSAPHVRDAVDEIVNEIEKRRRKGANRRMNGRTK